METSSISDIVTLTEDQPDEAEAEHSWQNDEMEADEVNSEESVDTTVNDILDLDVDPSTMLSSVNTLLETLESTLSSLAVLRDQSEEKDPVRDSIQTTTDECKKLHTQLTELEGVVSVYASRHEPGQPPNPQSHIDPSLYKWSTDCMIFLLELNAYIERLRGITDPDPDDDDEWADAFIDKEEAEDTSLEDYQMKLVVFNSDLAGFIPILKVDFNEHQTTNLRFPPAIAESSAEYSLRDRHDRDFFSRPDSSAERHRREMYALKDSLMECRDRLAKLIPQFADDVRFKMQALKAKQSVAVATLSEMLTNHPSEWLEASLAGKMSYEEFMRIPLSQITGFRLQVNGFMREVDVQQACGRAGRFLLLNIQELENIGVKQIDVDQLDEAMEKLLVLLKAHPRRKSEGEIEHPAAAAAAETDPFSNG